MRAALLAAALGAASAQAAVRPASVFTRGAVLQAGVPVAVWGQSDPGERVTVSFAGQRASTAAADGRWSVTLRPLEPGGPHAMRLEGAHDAVVLDDILVGEVWLVSGQSNIEFRVRQMEGGARAVAQAGDPGLRLFKVPVSSSAVPLDGTPGRWERTSPQTVSSFSAVGYVLGLELRRSLKVPVGIIEAAVGSTMAESWMPGRDLLRWLNRVVVADTRYMHPWDYRSSGVNFGYPPATLYNAMVHPLVPYALRGFVWHQGNNNTMNSERYHSLLPEFLSSWRRLWGRPELPIVLVQTEPNEAPSAEPQESRFAEVREAQFAAARALPKVALVVTTDLSEPGESRHPRRKLLLGRRVASAARAVAYGRADRYSGPVPERVDFGARAIIVRFRGAQGGLRGDAPLSGFAVAGQDRRFAWAKARIDRDTVVLESPVKEPVAVRYNWADFPTGLLRGADGLPVPPFRTDSFPMLSAGE